jgi:MFS family permease
MARPGFRLFHPSGLLPGTLIFLGVFGMAGFLAFVPVYVDEVGVSASVPLGIYATAVVVLRLLGAKLPDRLGPVRLSGVALVVTATGLALIGAIRSDVGLLVGTVAMSIGVAFTFPALVALAVNRVPADERGTVVGTTTVFLDLAFGIAPLVLGTIADITGYGPTFLVSSALAALGAVLLWTRRSRLVPGPVGRAGHEALA